ncbi:MAG: hypothetical protein IOC82_03380 [Aestuariivirga sp.]|uniref:hypothetical protein n=1 Tax=Aestuariivirga sp. TaxID=2650926 RepID=UPI0025BD2EC0|nr:hypothetical protein [Aestuariivirga sp.]MCA3560057.1 hypothetical protein [Aestuariivirga sp.]
MTAEATTYDKKLNAQRGAQRTGLKPGEFEVFKTPDGRFGWRAIAPAGDDQAPIQITEPEQATSPTSPKPGKRKAIIEQAQSGALPAAPDFSKPTHARFWAKLAKLVALAEAGDVEVEVEVEVLKAIEINLSRDGIRLTVWPAGRARGPQESSAPGPVWPCRSDVGLGWSCDFNPEPRRRTT